MVLLWLSFPRCLCLMSRFDSLFLHFKGFSLFNLLRDFKFHLHFFLYRCVFGFNFNCLGRDNCFFFAVDNVWPNLFGIFGIFMIGGDFGCFR
jgi:hypothetical protein